MTDDPRRPQTAAEVFHDAAVEVYCEKVAAVDPLRRLADLLADEDRAVDLIANAIYSQSIVSRTDRRTANG